MLYRTVLTSRLNGDSGHTAGTLLLPPSRSKYSANLVQDGLHLSHPTLSDCLPDLYSPSLTLFSYSLKGSYLQQVMLQEHILGTGF